MVFILCICLIDYDVDCVWGSVGCMSLRVQKDQISSVF